MVIPVHDRNPTRRPAVITYLLIAVNIAVFALAEPIARTSLVADQMTVATYCRQVAFFDEYAAIPRELTTNTPIRPHNVVDTDAGPQNCAQYVQDYFPHKRPVLSVLWAMFLHGGWLHLLGNMLFLYIFGNNVEDRFGRVKFLLFYLLCGYASAYGFALANADSTATLVGASGAIAGVLGAYLVLYPRAKVTALMPFLFFLPFRFPAWVVLGSWFVLQWFYNLHSVVAGGDSVAYLAHVIGFLLGFLIAIPVRRLTPMPRGQASYGVDVRGRPWRS